jgi:hypothetical protein
MAERPQPNANWPELLRRIQVTGERDEIQRLLEQFLRLAERDPEGMQYVLRLFSRTMDDWEEGALGRPAGRRVLRLVPEGHPRPLDDA